MKGIYDWPFFFGINRLNFAKDIMSSRIMFRVFAVMVVTSYAAADSVKVMFLHNLLETWLRRCSH